MADASPALFSMQYFSQLATVLRVGVHTGLVQTAWPEESFFIHQGWILALQGLLSLVLAFVFVRHRQQLAQVEHWRFVAKRPIAAGLLVGVMSTVVFYESPPDIVRLALAVLVGSAVARLVGGLLAGSWRRQFMYGVLILSILTDLCYVLGVPLTLFRLYIVVAALVMQTLKECALAQPGVMKDPEPRILFRNFGDSSLDFELYVRVAEVDNRLQIESDLRQEIERRFRQAGIEIPFPQRDLHVRSVEYTNNAAATVRAPLA